MSHAWIAVTHLDDEGYQRIVAEREQKKEDADAEQPAAVASNTDRSTSKEPLGIERLFLFPVSRSWRTW